MDFLGSHGCYFQPTDCGIAANLSVKFLCAVVNYLGQLAVKTRYRLLTCSPTHLTNLISAKLGNNGNGIGVPGMRFHECGQYTHNALPINNRRSK